MEIKCSHCGGNFLRKRKTGALVCKNCGCVFRVALARWEAKCYTKHHKKEIAEITEIIRKKKKHKKRKRKKRK